MPRKPKGPIYPIEPSSCLNRGSRCNQGTVVSPRRQVWFGFTQLHVCERETPFFRSHWSQPKQIEHQQPRCTEKWQSCYDLVTVDVGRGGWASWFYLLCTLWVDVDLTKKGARNPNSVRKANWTEAKNALSHIRFSPQVIRLCMLLIWLAGDIWENVLRTNVAEY